MGQTWAMRLPLGVADPMFLHELALELGIPVGEMCERMSARELTVEWPLFFEARGREERRKAGEAEAKARMGSLQTFGGG